MLSGLFLRREKICPLMMEACEGVGQTLIMLSLVEGKDNPGGQIMALTAQQRAACRPWVC